MILKCCLMLLKCCVYGFERMFNEFEMNFNYLSSCANLNESTNKAVLGKRNLQGKTLFEYELPLCHSQVLCLNCSNYKITESLPAELNENISHCIQFQKALTLCHLGCSCHNLVCFENHNTSIIVAVHGRRTIWQDFCIPCNTST